MIPTRFENYESPIQNIRSCGTRNTIEENYVTNRLGTFVCGYCETFVVDKIALLNEPNYQTKDEEP